MVSLFSGCAGVPLISAAREGNDREVNTLLDRGVDINARESGTTPLTQAIWYRHSSTAKLLIERGADVNQPAAVIHGYDTPLAIAAARGNFEVINLLINKGADLEYALSMCRQKSDTILVGHHYKSCQAALTSVKAKQQAVKIPGISKIDPVKTEQAAAQNIFKERQKNAGPSSVSSGIGSPSFAVSDKINRDDDLAIIVGIENYQSLPRSDHSSNDAVMMKQYLKALGFKERNIQIITDDKATKSSIEKSLEAWLKNRTKKSSTIVFYYSGHGAPDPANGEAYLVPYDGDPNYLSITGYPLRRLYNTLGNLQAAEIMVILDSCFSGTGGRSVFAKGARPLVISAPTITIPNNVAVIAATQTFQISMSSPEKGHGIFTYYFLKALNDGKKNISEIYAYIKPLVEDEAKQLNVLQSPDLNPAPEKLTGRFTLRKQ